jgi:predicted alpha/beta hydrolase family esterase
MQVLLMHGKDTDPTQKWYPWFMQELGDKGVLTSCPPLPKAADPILDEWLAVIDDFDPGESSVLVGHSRGGVALLRWLERAQLHLRVKKVILIATNSGHASHMDMPAESNYGFYTKNGFDFGTIKSHCDSFVVFHSVDDPWVSFKWGQENAEGLNAELVEFDDLKHFGRGVSEIPGLIEEVLAD